MHERGDEFGASGGKPAERLREQLARELGEVPEESPSEPERADEENESAEPASDEQGQGEVK
ncbi:MAG TPA: hypothetical protein VI300_30325 [Solirubrobacter sp.]